MKAVVLNSEQSASILPGRRSRTQWSSQASRHTYQRDLWMPDVSVVSGVMVLHIRDSPACETKLTIFGRGCQRISVSRGTGPFTTVAKCREDTMTKYAAPWVIRSRARCDFLCRDARLMPKKLSTRIASSITVAARFVIEPSTQIFAKCHWVGRTSDSKYHDIQDAGWKRDA